MKAKPFLLQSLSKPCEFKPSPKAFFIFKAFQSLHPKPFATVDHLYAKTLAVWLEAGFKKRGLSPEDSLWIFLSFCICNSRNRLTGPRLVFSVLVPRPTRRLCKSSKCNIKNSQTASDPPHNNILRPAAVSATHALAASTTTAMARSISSLPPLVLALAAAGKGGRGVPL